MSLFVGNLSRHARQKDLELAFGRYGACRVQMKEGYAFVIYAVVRDAEAALTALCGKPLSDEFPRITWSKRQPSLTPSGPVSEVGTSTRWIHNKEQADPHQHRTGDFKGEQVDNVPCNAMASGVWPPEEHISNCRKEGPNDLVATGNPYQICSNCPARPSIGQLKAAFFISGPGVAHRQESLTDRVKRDASVPAPTDGSPGGHWNDPNGKSDKKNSPPTGGSVLKHGRNGHSRNGLIRDSSGRSSDLCVKSGEPAHVSCRTRGTGYVNNNDDESDRPRGQDVESCKSIGPSRGESWSTKPGRNGSDQRETLGHRGAISDYSKDPVIWKEKGQVENNKISHRCSIPPSSSPPEDERHHSKGTRLKKRDEMLDSQVSNGPPGQGTKRKYVDIRSQHHCESSMEYLPEGSRARVSSRTTPKRSPRRSSSRSSHSLPYGTSVSASRSGSQERSPTSRQSSSSSFPESKSLSRSPVPFLQTSLAATASPRSRSYSPASISLARSESQRSASPSRIHALGAVNAHRPVEIASKYLPKSVSLSPNVHSSAEHKRNTCGYSRNEPEKGTKIHSRGEDRHPGAGSNAKRREFCFAAPDSDSIPFGKNCTIIGGRAMPSVSGKKVKRESVLDNLDPKCNLQIGEYYAVKRLKGNGRPVDRKCEMEDVDKLRTSGSGSRSRGEPERNQANGMQMIKDKEEGYVFNQTFFTNSEKEQGRTATRCKEYRGRKTQVNESSGMKSDQESGEISREPVMQRTEVASSDENDGIGAVQPSPACRSSKLTREIMKSDPPMTEPEGALYGGARFWPWEAILARRYSRGPISIENFERRRAQNAAHSIVDKYVRSSSGWWERDYQGRLLDPTCE